MNGSVRMVKNNYIYMRRANCLRCCDKLIKFNSLSSSIQLCKMVDLSITWLRQYVVPRSSVECWDCAFHWNAWIRAVNNSINRMTQFNTITAPNEAHTNDWNSMHLTPPHTSTAVRTMNARKQTEKKICLSKPLTSTMRLESRRIYYYYRFLEYFRQSTHPSTM